MNWDQVWSSDSGRFWTVSAAVGILLYLLSPVFGAVYVLAFQVFYLIISYSSQKQDELGGKFFFGRFIQQTMPGLVVAWKGIIEHKTVSQAPQNTEFPTDNLKEELITDEEAVQRRKTKEEGGENGNGVDHYRMTHGYGKDSDEDQQEEDKGKVDPLSRGRLTTKVSVILTWQVVDVKKFYTNAVSREAFLKQMEDSAATETRKAFKDGTAAEIYARWQEIEGNITKHLQNIVSEKYVGEDGQERAGFDYGVKIAKFSIKEVDLTKEINEAFSAQIASQIDIQTKRNKGLSKKVFNELKALGDKALRKAFLDGEAEGLEGIAKKLGLDHGQKSILLQSQVLRDALKEANFNLLSTEGLGIVGAIQQTLDLAGGKTTPQPKQPPTQNGGSQ
ncbi:MAG: SPFH domain-containing protein [Nitrososphaera sp.]|nr:SPFH domain-containing protein [Nitrososphaera sp.]